MHRRTLMRVGAGGSLSALLKSGWTRTASAAEAPPGAGAFDNATVPRLARALARQPFQAADTALPAALENLTYDQYRGIRFRPERALWRGQDLPFQAQLFSRGFLYRERVEIFEVIGGQAAPVPYSPDLFEHADAATKPGGTDLRAGADFGFAGFRIHAPVDRPDFSGEVCAFLGASYFRAVARGQVYGLSARGLAIGTGDPGGEEFGRFTTFWLERPQPNVNSLVIHALLDSASATGAYRFTMRPGEETVFDVQSVLFPRVDITTAGIATLTSMFFFDANDRRAIDDWRPAVHDSQGLSMITNDDAPIWRPLVNPRETQTSDFADTHSPSYGLMQRKRAFTDYLDPAVFYNRRPSLWIEPIGDWGRGEIQLVEIPTSNETEDNIVAFWRPRDKLEAGGEHAFAYRMHWGWADAARPGSPTLGRFTDTRVGEAEAPGSRFFVLDLGGEAMRALAPNAAIHADVGASAGRIENVLVARVEELSGWRISFDLAPGDARSVEIHCVLADKRGALSETWLYRWTA